MSERLPSLEGSASERRASIVERLGRLVPSDFQAFVGISEAGGTSYYDSVACAGDTVTTAGWAGFVGTPFVSPWDPRSPQPAHINRFRVGMLDGLDLEQKSREPAYRRMYEPWGLEHDLRILVYDGHRCVGWLGALRHSGSKPFGATAPRAAASGAQWLVTAAIAATRAEDLGRPSSGSLLFRPDGTLEIACAVGAVWLTAKRASRLSSNVRCLDSSGADAHPLLAIEGTSVSFVRLAGDGPTRYLCILAPAARVVWPVLLRLTPRQCEVAELAAVGATAKEIGLHLDISVETVRSHLKAIYQRLGVANRVELASARRNDPHWMTAPEPETAGIP